MVQATQTEIVDEIVLMEKNETVLSILCTLYASKSSTAHTDYIKDLWSQKGAGCVHLIRLFSALMYCIVHRHVLVFKDEQAIHSHHIQLDYVKQHGAPDVEKFAQLEYPLQTEMITNIECFMRYSAKHFHIDDCIFTMINVSDEFKKDREKLVYQLNTIYKFLDAYSVMKTDHHSLMKNYRKAYKNRLLSTYFPSLPCQDQDRVLRMRSEAYVLCMKTIIPLLHRQLKLIVVTM